jgi:hypothetical protein
MYKPQFELFSHARPIESLLGFRNVNMEITGKELPEDVAAIYLTENAGCARFAWSRHSTV